MAKCSVNWNDVPWQEPGYSCSLHFDFAAHHLLLLFIYLFSVIIIWCLAKMKKNSLGLGDKNSNRWLQHFQNLWIICISELGILSLMRLWFPMFTDLPLQVFPGVSFNRSGILWALCRAGSCHECAVWHTRPFLIPNKPDWCRKEMASHRQIFFLSVATTVTVHKCSLRKGTFPLQDNFC